MSKIIVTHDGTFHADEVMAIAILKALYKDVAVIRTRDGAVIADAKPHFIVDVGGEYNHLEGKYDHHQIDDDLMREDGVPYSSVGLVWKHFGKSLLTYYGVKEDILDKVFNQVDYDLIRPIDMIDTGFKIPVPEVPEIHFSLVISRMNSRNVFNQGAQELAFNQALEVSMSVLKSFVYSSYDIVLAESEFHHRAEGGRLIVEMPYGFHLRKLSYKYPSLRAAFYPRGDGNWNVSVTKPEYHFDEKVAGQSLEQINNFFNIKDAVFVHKAGFIAVVGSRESALVLAKHIEEKSSCE